MHTPPPDTLPLTLLWTVVILPRSLYYREMSRQKTSFHLMKSNNLLHLRQEHVSCIWHAGQSIALFFLFPISLFYCLYLPELSQPLMFFLGTTHPQNKGDNKIYTAPYHPPNEYRWVTQTLNEHLFARTAALGRNGLAGLCSKLQNRTCIFFFLHSVMHSALVSEKLVVLLVMIAKTGTRKEPMSPVNALNVMELAKSKID